MTKDMTAEEIAIEAARNTSAGWWTEEGREEVYQNTVKALKSYALQESKMLMEAIEEASRRIQADTLGETGGPLEVLEQALTTFNERNGK